MKRALVLYRVDKSEPSNLGVVYKMKGQINGLQAAGYQVDFIIHDKSSIYKNAEVIATASTRASFKWNYYDHIHRDHLVGYTLYLLRYGLSTSSFVKVLSAVHSQNKQAKILIDMPTYPYSQEWEGWKGKLVIFLDRLYRSHLRKYVDYVIHSGEERSIYGIPTIRLANGIDLDRIPMREELVTHGKRMIAVGKWRSWHGLDRLIRGLSICDRSQEVSLDVIGDGPNLPQLRALTRSLGLENQVSFHGAQAGQELTRLFEAADIAVGTLGLHRKGVKWDSSLKHREYVARGIPFIMAGQDVDISAEESFVHHVSADDSPIELKDIFDFLENIAAHLSPRDIRSYAEKHLSWTHKMSQLCEILER